HDQPAHGGRPAIRTARHHRRSLRADLAQADDAPRADPPRLRAGVQPFRSDRHRPVGRPGVRSRRRLPDEPLGDRRRLRQPLPPGRLRRLASV
ncbi:MAG: hypothetical protein AVDCRST_MAG33-867, partial [uncultured Thermomicrobiales bacterium]